MMITVNEITSIYHGLKVVRQCGKGGVYLTTLTGGNILIKKLRLMRTGECS